MRTAAVSAAVLTGFKHINKNALGAADRIAAAPRAIKLLIYRTSNAHFRPYTALHLIARQRKDRLRAVCNRRFAKDI